MPLQSFPASHAFVKRLLTGTLLCGALLLPMEAQEAPVSPETANDFPPQKFDPGRYKKIWAKNPFVAEVVNKEEDPVEGEEWAKGLILRAVTRIEGKYVVHVEDTALANEKDPLKARRRYQRLVQDEPDQSRGDLRIVRVKAHRDPNQVEVTVSKTAEQDGTEAVVKYDSKALLAQAPPVRLTPQNPRQPQRTPEGNSAAAPGAVVVVPETAAQTAPAAANQGRPQVRGQQRGNRGGVRGAGGQRGGRNQGDRGRGGRRGGDTPQPPERRVVLPPGVNR